MSIEQAARFLRHSAKCWEESREFLLAVKRSAPFGSTMRRLAEADLVALNAAKPNFFYLLAHLEQYGWAAKAEDVPQKGDAL